jgi:DTW domain-containing protein YfiP
MDNKPNKKSKEPKGRPPIFPLRLDPKLRGTLDELAEQHDFQLTRILESGAWHEVRRLKKLKPYLKKSADQDVPGEEKV